MYNIIFSSVILMTGLFAVGSTIYRAMKEVDMGKKEGKKVDYKIAIVAPAVSALIQDMIDGCVETLEKEGTFGFDTHLYDAKGDRTLLRSNIESVFSDEFNLVYTLGTEATKLAKEISERRGSSTPIVFVGVRDPIKLGLVASESQPGGNVTGITGDHNYKLELDLLLMVKENVKQMLIVYDPTQLGGYNVQARQMIEEYLEGRNIKTTAIEIFKADEIEGKTLPFIANVDALLILLDHTVMTNVERVVKMCNEHGVTLMASDLGSVKKGAALGFGYLNYDVGVEAAHLVQEILGKKRNVRDVSLTDMGNKYKLFINASVIKSQKLVLDERKLFLMRYAQVVSNGKQGIKGHQKVR